ncbi:MAG: hypothetical protein A3F43_06675 [Gammaproteobacteria bacterium RIFCSPHIGHO2_12_FULL_42_10]|nr:MAG: hypothetical protein A3F43_06675 [Gammaproteobacteria bacterium RIFCSPHIGHO2_12_FULL_42_10]
MPPADQAHFPREPVQAIDYLVFSAFKHLMGLIKREVPSRQYSSRNASTNDICINKTETTLIDAITTCFNEKDLTTKEYDAIPGGSLYGLYARVDYLYQLIEKLESDYAAHEIHTWLEARQKPWLTIKEMLQSLHNATVRCLQKSHTQFDEAIPLLSSESNVEDFDRIVRKTCAYA